MSFRLTILGKSPSWQDRDGACTGYLLELGGLSLLLDCGSGVFAKLRHHTDYQRLDGVVLSHLHADHILDLVPFAYALTVGPQLRAGRPLLYGPPGTRDALRRLCGTWGSETLIESAFELHEYDPQATLELNGLRIRFQAVPHYVPAYALELRAHDGGRRLVFSADCGPNPELVEFARAADLLLIEATSLDETMRLDEGRRFGDDSEDPPGHLTAAEAGAIGQRAGVGRLVLTHFSDQLDAARIRALAQAAFGRAVELAAEGQHYDI